MHYQRAKRGTLNKQPKDPRICKYEGCSAAHYAKGYCNRHWQRDHVGRLHDADLRRRPNGVAAIRDAQGRKQCSACKLWLPPENNFRTHAKTSDGLQVRCNSCVFVARHFTQYQLKPADIARIMEAQAHRCAICDADISGRYVVDHDHKCCAGIRSCGRCVRGFLCDGCNLGLGAFKDSTEAMQKAIEYIKRH